MPRQGDKSPMLKVISWNVNSLKARFDRVNRLLERHQPDFLCLQELKGLEESFPTAHFHDLGYHCAVLGQKTYNGVAVLSRQPLETLVRGFADGTEDPAARFILVTTRESLSVASVYVP